MPAYSKYPSTIDDSTSLPLSTDLVTDVKAEVVNRLRDSILKIQNELGINPSAEYGTVKDRLDFLQAQISTLISQTENLLLFSCDGYLSVGDVVAQVGDTVVLADATNANLQAIGMIVDKPTSTTAFVKNSGQISLSPLSPGEKYYLSETTPGAITSAEPTLSGSFIQYLGFAKTSSVFVIQISNSVIFL